MNTEDNQGKGYPPQRIAAALILGTMAAAIVGTTVNSILQCVPAPWPHWAIWFLVIGGIVFVVAMLILVPCHWWRNIRSRVLGIPRWGKWKLREPSYSISISSISQDLLETGCKYTAVISLCIKNRDKYPMTIDFGWSKLNLVQLVRRNKLHCSLTLNDAEFPQRSEVPPREEVTYQVPLELQLNATVCLDIKRHYDWGVQGISVYLSGIGMKELHKGIYDKHTRYVLLA